MDMKSNDLAHIYYNTNQQTMKEWRNHPHIGDVKPGYYDYIKLAVTSGIKPPLTGPIAQLFNDIEEQLKNDPLADLLPRAGFHFTFLPLTLPLYTENQRLPGKARRLLDIWHDYDAKNLHLRELRLIALPSQLLLAGIPDDSNVVMRRTLCEKVLDSPWRDELLARHSSSPLPAPFWHSTLLRYNAAFLPEIMRTFFRNNRSRRFGDVSGELQLAMVNYNWTRGTSIDNAIVYQ
jgi:hypothetical protein